MSGVTVLEAGQQHIEELLPLFEAFRASYKKDPAPDQARHFLLDRLKPADPCTTLLARQEGTAVGFIQLYSIYSCTRMATLWIPNAMFVSPDHRRLGIGKALVTKSKELAKASAAVGVHLGAEKDNEASNRLYTASGFVQDHDTNFYFWSNPDWQPS